MLQVLYFNCEQHSVIFSKNEWGEIVWLMMNFSSEVVWLTNLRTLYVHFGIKWMREGITNIRADDNDGDVMELCYELILSPFDLVIWYVMNQTNCIWEYDKFYLSPLPRKEFG